MEFDFSRYSKIVANDLSLNGSISSALGGLSQWSSSGDDIYFSNGNIGIGTTSPGAKLDLSGALFLRNETRTFPSGGGGGNATEEVALVFNAGTNNRTLALKTDSDASLYGTTGTGGGRSLKWRLSGSGTTFFSTGVSIGTDNPNRTLTIYDAISPAIQLINSSTGSSTSDGMHLEQYGASTYLTNKEYGNIFFRTQNDTTRMMIQENGFVGIGTTTPLTELNVYGSVNPAVRVTTYTNGAGRHVDLLMETSSADAHIINRENTELYLWTNSTKRVEVGRDGYTTFFNGHGNSSDNRMKHNEQIITNALSTIRQVECKHYIKTTQMYDEDYNFTLDASGNPTNAVDASGNAIEYHFEDGIIAQEILQIPELAFSVHLSGKEDSPHSVNYQALYIRGIVALQELDAEHTQTKLELQEEKTKVATLESQLADVLQRLSNANL